MPVALSAFTHLWNPIGFPSMHYDEGHYMRRAMIILEGHGPQEFYEPNLHRYDHPYFGQVFLAGMLWMIGYPDSIHPNPDDISSVEMLYLIPRVLIGILAVVDTFLVYKIAQRMYNRKVAFIAAILFAVMPLGWLLRRVVLDSLLLPFLLSSIYFAVRLKGNNNNNKNYDYAYIQKIRSNPKPNVQIASKREDKSQVKKRYSTVLGALGNNVQHDSSINSNIYAELLAISSRILTLLRDNNRILLTLLSGIFLGLAIFTKVPAFTMIPLVGFLIFTNSKSTKSWKSLGLWFSKSTKSWKILGLWFIPVISIPLIWPAYAMSIGEFGEWLDGIVWQGTQRSNAGILDSVNDIFTMDPVLVTISLLGIILGILKKDLFVLFWIGPFLMMLYLLNWTVHFHWIPVLPVFCIAGALLIENVSSRIIKIEKKSTNTLAYWVTCGIGLFGFVSTILLVSTNISAFQLEALAFALGYMTDNPGDTTLLAGAIYSWIPKYVFDYDNVFSDFKWQYSEPGIKTSNVLLMIDRFFERYISDDEGDLENNHEATKAIDDNLNTYWSKRNEGGAWIQADVGPDKIICGVDIAWYKNQKRSYNFEIWTSNDIEEEKFRKILYGNSKMSIKLSPERYDITDVKAQYLRIYVKNSSEGNFAISDISVYGNTGMANPTNSQCKSLEINSISESNILPSTIFEDYQTSDGNKEYTNHLKELYQETNNITSFYGDEEIFERDNYPYNIVKHSRGGGFVDIRAS